MIGRMVLFGASGDLTSRLLMPAVAQLAEAGLLPSGFTVLGSANTDWSTGDFRRVLALRFANRVFEPIWKAKRPSEAAARRAPHWPVSA